MKTYDFRDVNVIITNSAGVQNIITGFANNSTIEADMKNDAFTIHVGAKGGDDVAAARNNDHSGTIKFKLMNTADSNKDLIELYNSGNTFSTKIVDGNDLGKSEADAPECVIQKPAPFTRGEEIQGLEWTIGVLNLSIHYI